MGDKLLGCVGLIVSILFGLVVGWLAGVAVGLRINSFFPDDQYLPIWTGGVGSLIGAAAPLAWYFRKQRDY